jgi:thymidylate synthase
LLTVFSSLDDAYLWIIESILTNGEYVAPRSMPTRELRAIGITICDPRRRYISLPPRRWSFGYALGELCWHLRGSDLLSDIRYYSERWREMSDDGVTIRSSCYGAKIFVRRGSAQSQWESVRETIASDAASRRAIFDFSDGNYPDAIRGRDVNCATTLQFLVRSGKLEAICTMRSNDIILGLPYDVFLFTVLQEMMAVELGLDTGPYHHCVGSLHIYESNLTWSSEIARARPSISEPMPRMRTTSLVEFLKGEFESRDQKTRETMLRVADPYWNALLEVLQYYNSSRAGEALDAGRRVETSLYDHLIRLTDGAHRNRGESRKV